MEYMVFSALTIQFVLVIIFSFNIFPGSLHHKVFLHNNDMSISAPFYFLSGLFSWDMEVNFRYTS